MQVCEKVAMKSRDGKSQKREEKKNEDRRRYRVRKKEDAGAPKVATHCVVPLVCGSEGRKVGSLKRRVPSYLATWQAQGILHLAKREQDVKFL